jgi:hypothetical protein
MSVIESADYEECRQRLMKDPIVINMAGGLRGIPLMQMVHQEDVDENGKLKDPHPTPRFEFMMSANAEYRERGGTDGGHMGAIAEALIRLVQGG